MCTLDDRGLSSNDALEIVNAVGRRTLTHAIHDVDGTHSLIRDWPPVMSRVIHWAMTCGLGEDFDRPATVASLIRHVGAEPLPETDRFCVESAGLSALTQMEYGIRRAVELGNAPSAVLRAMTPDAQQTNAAIIRRIWNGEERFDDLAEPPAFVDFIRERTPRLFRLYEQVLYGASRDRNLAAARRDPAVWRIPGSLEFLAYLKSLGCVNYFVTGAVIEEGRGMLEEVQVLGYDIGPGRMVEAIEGSTWDRKRPKDEVMCDLCARLEIDPRQVLVVGDGRAEISAGAAMGAVTMSRLALDAHRQRALHRQLGTNYLVPDYTAPALRQLIR
jgi:phosphoglycolate phosphatase-like HAD superfamily hydrolase